MLTSQETMHRADEDLLTCTYWSSPRCMCYTGVSIPRAGRDQKVLILTLEHNT